MTLFRSQPISGLATAQYFDLSNTWLWGQSNEEASDPLLDPFAIVTDHQKCHKMSTSGCASDNKDIPILSSKGDKLHEASLPTSHPMKQPTSNSFANAQSMSNICIAGVKTFIFNSKSYSDPLSHDSGTKSLRIPTRLNPQENGLH